jgi:hypothetical protein
MSLVGTILVQKIGIAIQQQKKEVHRDKLLLTSRQIALLPTPPTNQLRVRLSKPARPNHVVLCNHDAFTIREMHTHTARMLPKVHCIANTCALIYVASP